MPMTRISTTIDAVNRYLYDDPLPIDFDEQIHEMFDWHWLIRSPGNQHATCSYCGQRVELDRLTFKHGDTERCPYCEKNVKIRDVKKNTNYGRWTEYMVVRLIKSFGNIFTEISFCTWNSIVEHREVSRSEPYELRICQGKEIRNYKKGYCYEFENSHYAWISGRDNDAKKHWNNKVIFQSPIEQMIAESDVKYACIDKANPDGGFNLNWIVMARKYPFVEMLWKSGMKNLFHNYMDDESGKATAKRYIREHRELLKKTNPNFNQIEWLDAWVKGLEFKDYELLLKVKNYIGSFDPEVPFIRFLGNRNEIPKFFKYLAKQNCSAYHYMDYVKLMNQIGTPVDKNTKYPKDINAAHNDATKKFNIITQEAKIKDFENIREKFKDQTYQSMGFAVLIPIDAQDVLREGKVLSHCVGSYINDIASGNTMILFVRKADDLETPYYTMEYREGKIAQCRGDHNKPMPDDVKKFTEDWLKWTKRPKKAKVKSHDQAAIA